MRYFVLAVDYDGTLAHDGRVSGSTVEAMKRLLASGRRLIMVTGRELPELRATFPHLELFDSIVAENGGLLYRPMIDEETLLSDPPPENFVEALHRRGVTPMSIGRVVVAAWQPQEHLVLDAIREVGIEWHVVFNKGAVMALPFGVNKASGLTAALKVVGLSPQTVVGIGDAENDHAFLRLCGFSAAVANALPALKEAVDLTTSADHGDGVAELIDAIVASDLSEYAVRGPRVDLPQRTTNDAT